MNSGRGSGMDVHHWTTCAVRVARRRAARLLIRACLDARTAGRAGRRVRVTRFMQHLHAKKWTWLVRGTLIRRQSAGKKVDPAGLKPAWNIESPQLRRVRRQKTVLFLFLYFCISVYLLIFFFSKELENILRTLRSCGKSSIHAGFQPAGCPQDKRFACGLFGFRCHSSLIDSSAKSNCRKVLDPLANSLTSTPIPASSGCTRRTASTSPRSVAGIAPPCR